MGIAAKNIMIGIFVVIALGIIIFILLFLHPTVGDSAKTLRVRFTNIDKVTLGTRVTYAGKAVGEVVNIRELEDVRNERIARNGDVYVYELTLKVDSSVSVYNTDSITTYTSGLLGERGIEINPEPLKPGEAFYLVEDQILYATPARSIEETLQNFEKVARTFDTVLININKTVDEIRDAEVIKKAGQAVDHIHQLAESLNQPEKWNSLLDNISSLSQSAKDAWPTVEDSINNIHQLSEKANNSWGNIDSALTDFNSSSGKFSTIMTHITEGKGSLGRLIMNEDLYLRFKSVFGKADTLMDDIKNYGILFQNNKKWQRVAAQRKNLLGKLANSDQFNAYFNHSLEQASDSLAGVSMVLNDANNYPSNLMDDPSFTRRFGDLLRKVTELEDDLKMYNQQVVDQDQQQCMN